MKLLFIPSIIDHDWDTLCVKAAIILGFWVCMVVAVLIDLRSGISKARALGEKVQSHKLRRTIDKIGDYWRVLAMALVFDIIASLLPFYGLPYASVLVTLACIIIELKSVLENASAKKSSAAQIPDIISEIIKCTDTDKASELVKRLKELGDKHPSNTK